MNKKTEVFLNELAEVLRRNDAVIVRSGNSTNDIVVSVRISPDDFDELTFAEGISETDIKNEWYC
jgi:hypothetical protein